MWRQPHRVLLELLVSPPRSATHRTRRAHPERPNNWDTSASKHSVSPTARVRVRTTTHLQPRAYRSVVSSFRPHRSSGKNRTTQMARTSAYRHTCRPPDTAKERHIGLASSAERPPGMSWAEIVGISVDSQTRGGYRHTICPGGPGEIRCIRVWVPDLDKLSYLSRCRCHVWF